MRSPTLGPLEFVAVALPGDRPASAMLRALQKQVEMGAIRLLDIVVVSGGLDGRIDVIEVDAREFALAGLELSARGVVDRDDIRRLCTGVPAGERCILALIELSWERQMRVDITISGATVVTDELLPASAADAVLAGVRETARASQGTEPPGNRRRVEFRS